MSEEINARLDTITVPRGRRPIRDIAPLADSMRELGQLQAIGVTKDRTLVYGAHRLKAAKHLGWNTIRALVLDLDDLHRELAEIDENLVREDLTQLERSEYSARRKRVYEAIHPQTKPVNIRGGPGRGHKTNPESGSVSRTPAFVDDTASKTHRSRAAIAADVQIAESIPDKVRDTLRDTASADSKEDLLALARLKKDPDKQARVAEAVATGEAKNVREAVRSERLAERHARNAETAKQNQAAPAAERQYSVICSDPPWRYEHAVSTSREIEEQYPTLSLDEIKRLKIGGRVVPDCATTDAILFLWATSPKLAEAMEVIVAWGFTYRTCAVWDKEKIGMGYYFRQQHELLLVATRGNPPAPPADARVASVFRERRGEHSAKPDCVYVAIESMYPEAARLEMFARGPRPGWDVWGNEAKTSVAA